MADPLLQTLAPYAAPAAALVGVAVGRFWEGRDEHKRWLRAQRLAGYAQATDACLQFLLTAQRAWQTSSQTAASDMKAALDLAQASGGTILLLGPKSVHMAFGTTIDNFIDLKRAVQAGIASGTQCRYDEIPEYGGASSSFNEFLRSAQSTVSAT